MKKKWKCKDCECYQEGMRRERERILELIKECSVYELFEGNTAGEFIRKSELKQKIKEKK